MEKPKFTYILGAGASANVLPVVQKMPDKINGLIKILSNAYKLPDTPFESKPNVDRTKLGLQKNFQSDLQWVLDNISNKISIDTFAKKLFLRDDDAGLKRLKATITAFFKILQLIGGVDKRYDSFFAALLEKDGNYLHFFLNS